ncbi:MAG: diacylglycerol/lipid kinase family protein [Spirochaetota bacterium]
MNRYWAIAEQVAYILRFSKTVGEGPLSIDIVLNTKAGALAHKRRLKKVERVFRLFTDGLEGERRSADSVAVRYHFTQYHGHAREIARRILLVNTCARCRRVVVSLGGDGTHGDLLSVLSTGPSEVTERMIVFRVPLGSGNDGADDPLLVNALRLMLSAETAHGVSYIAVQTADGRRLDAFNIVSVGIDAFVTDVSARLKKLAPGNLYRIAAAVSAAFYQLLLPLGRMRVVLTAPNGASMHREGGFLLVAMGPTGRRNYGNGMRILPNGDNVCLVRRLSALRILLLKGLMYRGEHVGLDAVETQSAGALTVAYDRKLTLQCDGEAQWLLPSDFPIRFERAWSGIGVVTPLRSTAEMVRSTGFKGTRKTPTV